MEPWNQKSQMDQEYGLLPADARRQQFELTVMNSDKGQNSIAALVGSMPPVD